MLLLQNNTSAEFRECEFYANKAPFGGALTSWVRCFRESFNACRYVCSSSNPLQGIELAKNAQGIAINSFQHLDLQDSSKLFVSKSDFRDNHFTGCNRGGGAMSITVSIDTKDR